MELLLTGATGFVGRNLLLRLIPDARFSRIILPVRDPEKLKMQLSMELRDAMTMDQLGDRLQIVKVSGDAWEIPGRVRPDLAIHAAGRLFGREREGYFQTNMQGSLNLARQLPEITRMIVLSSLAAGGPTPKGKESRSMDHDDAPFSFYGASKLAMEKRLQEKLGSRLLILRPPMVLGARDTATVPLFQMAKGVVRVKPGFQPKQYSWIAVDDLCDALLAAAMSQWPDDRKPFYLTGSGSITDTMLLATAAEVIAARGITLPLPHAVIQGVSILLDSIPALREAVPSLGRDRVREILPNRWVCDGSEFAKAFDWKPRRGFAETLKATAEWLKNRDKI
ncbi:MAG: NAD(P)-dependent oxidoreductase [bacterium]